MANKVFANGREISCKAGSGKSIAAFPDVCFTPPQTPATPPGVPIPYPNTGMSSDTTKGSKNVKISGKEVILKNKSYFKKSTGDEPGNAPKKGVVTSTHRGKVYFTSWSMDVKFEGENVVRHLDMTTHNHSSQPPNTPPWPFIDSMAISSDPCATEKANEEAACGGKSKAEACGDEKCREARGCRLVPKKLDKKLCCPPATTGDHLIEDHWIRDESGALLDDFKHLEAKSGRRYAKRDGPYQGAPTMCVDGGRFDGKHGIASATRGVMEDTFIGPQRKFTYAAGRAMAYESVQDAYPTSGCSKACINAQLDAFYGPDPVGPDGRRRNRPLRKPGKRQALSAEQRTAALQRVFPGRS